MSRADVDRFYEQLHATCEVLRNRPRRYGRKRTALPAGATVCPGCNGRGVFRTGHRIDDCEGCGGCGYILKSRRGLRGRSGR